MDTYEKIKKVAIEHFGLYGYQGASLAKITEEVGIKKPSLYAHYDSKKALFETCMASAMADFMDESKKVLCAEKKSGEHILYELPASFLDDEKHFDTDRLFYLRFVYMPPEELGENKVRYSNDFIEALASLLDKPINKLLLELDISLDRHDEAEEAYLCMFDGLMVELLFGENKSYSKRLEAAWKVFMRGIR